jgi:protoporphyrin/coproporphyrin ferrochelatase
MRYDALLLVSFGGPEKPGDVIPFLENVTRGRGIPCARLDAVAEHYYLFDGVSPINDQCRALRAALQDLLGNTPVYWGNRNWAPYLTDTVRQMAADGIGTAAAFVTSAYRGYSCCRQYLDDIDLARAEAGPGAPVIEKLPIYCDQPGFVQPMIDNVRAALDRLPADARLVCTAHSVPMSQPGRELYVADLNRVAAKVAAAVDRPFDLVYQSRSGPPSVPWLEPDVGDHLRKLHAEDVTSVVLAPIGFVSDHMEVVYDLDVEAAELADSLGMRLERAATSGTDPRFAAMVVDLMEREPSRFCAADCCRARP